MKSKFPNFWNQTMNRAVSGTPDDTECLNSKLSSCIEPVKLFLQTITSASSVVSEQQCELQCAQNSGLLNKAKETSCDQRLCAYNRSLPTSWEQSTVHTYDEMFLLLSFRCCHSTIHYPYTSCTTTPINRQVFLWARITTAIPKILSGADSFVFNSHFWLAVQWQF